jgi:hypothetical protein
MEKMVPQRMEAIDQTLMERYWANEMSPTEKRNFEQRLSLKQDCNRNLKNLNWPCESIRLAERKELMQRFMQRDKILDKKNQVNPPGRTRTLWLLSAAAIIYAFMIAWHFLLSPAHTPDQADIYPKDTTTIHTNTAKERHPAR